MASYGYQNKFKTVAWDSVGRLEEDYNRDADYNHDVEVMKRVPKITYTTGGEEYYPQVACSWFESQYEIDFKDTAIRLVINSHWKEPELDENGSYQYDDLVGEDTIELVRVDKKEGKVKKYKVIEEEEVVVTDVLDKVKYGMEVSVEEAVKDGIKRAKQHDSILVVGYYDDLRRFVATGSRFGYGRHFTIDGKELSGKELEDYLNREERDRHPDSRYVVYVTKDDTWEIIKENLKQHGYHRENGI